MDGRIQQLAERLRERGGRMTPQRMAVLKVLASDDSHPTIDEVYQRVQAIAPMTSLATVYKTVALLKEMGEVLELNPSGDETHVDGFHPHPHPHLICIRCGRIADVAVDDLPQMLGHIAGEAAGWQVQERLDFWGVCPTCRANEQ